MARRSWSSALAIVIAAGIGCRFDPTGVTSDGDGGAQLPDADPNAPDADPNAPDAAAPPDAEPGAPDAAPPPDAEPPAPDARACEWSYTPLYFDPCDDTTPDPDGPLGLSATGTYRYDTDSGELEAPDGAISSPESSVIGDARVIWVRGLVVGSSSTLRVEGSRPFVAVSFGDINVLGQIDASSYFAGGEYHPGAGADPDGCPASPPDPGETCAQHAGSGGGGGAFGGDGGSGGLGGEGRDCGGAFPDGMPGGAGGDAVALPVALRGGCGGRDGAPNDTAGPTYGAGGPGGGAVHLTARETLRVGGVVHAGGAGGGPGVDDRSGGGGGGSGGMIGLEAGDVRILTSSVIAANGGGGGGGCDNGVAGSGVDGAADANAASGGAGQGSGGDGGAGGARAVVDGVDADPASRGGGGGGGGAGHIAIDSPTAPTISGTATVSPTPVVR